MDADLTRDGEGREDSTFGEAIPLPRGPHQLSETEIAQSQRIRLMTALTELMAEKGWAGLTIGDIVGRAGVSRSAFYENFADKEACMLEAYEVFGNRVLRIAMENLDPSLPWYEFARKALAAYLGAIQSDPAAARAFMVEMDSAGLRSRQVRRDTIEAFAKAMEQAHRTVREKDPSLADSELLPLRVYMGTVLGVRELIRRELDDDPNADITDLVDDIVAWVTAMIRGAR